MRSSIHHAAAAALSLVVLASPGQAGPRNDDPAEQRLTAYSGHLPGCADPGVIGELTGEFASREATYWGSGLAISGVDKVREIGWRPWGLDFIPRRFCLARVQLNNLQYSMVSYSIREKLGLIGWTWDVNWCVEGSDRHKSYAPECKMARP